MLSGKILEQRLVGENKWDGNRKNLLRQCEENNVFASKLLFCNLNYILTIESNKKYSLTSRTVISPR